MSPVTVLPRILRPILRNILKVFEHLLVGIIASCSGVRGHFGPAVTHRVFGTGSGFHVGWRTAVGV